MSSHIVIHPPNVTEHSDTSGNSWKNGKYFILGVGLADNVGGLGYIFNGTGRVIVDNLYNPVHIGGDKNSSSVRTFSDSTESSYKITKAICIRDPYVVSSYPNIFIYQGVNTSNITGYEILTTYYTNKISHVVHNISGEYIELKFPFKYKLITINIRPPDTSSNAKGTPYEYYILGANEPNNWELISTHINNVANNTSTVMFPIKLNVNSNEFYKYHKFIFTKINNLGRCEIRAINLDGYAFI